MSSLISLYYNVVYYTLLFDNCSAIYALVVTQRIQHQLTYLRKIGSLIQFTTVGFGSSSLNKDKGADC